MEVSYEPTICDRIDQVVRTAVTTKRKILRVTLTKAERHQLYVHSGDSFMRANRTMVNFYGSDYRGVYTVPGTSMPIHIFAAKEQNDAR